VAVKSTAIPSSDVLPPPAASPPVPVEAAPRPVGRLAVTCSPACDTIEIDGRAVDVFPAEVEPGSHTVVARRGTLPVQKKTVNVGTTKPSDIAFVWATGRPPAKAPPKKPCGKFLQRCD
jgi:hypothetical protein